MNRKIICDILIIIFRASMMMKLLISLQNEVDIFSQVLGSVKIARLERFGATRNGKNETRYEIRNGRRNKVTAHYEAKCDSLQAKCDAMQILSEQVIRQLNCSSSTQPLDHSPNSFEHEFEGLC
ncbi:LOW QUALITY PROTEIN: hypothetical protein PanWU01x14_071580 [Parasponia andersonii]|uniref:Uncharacterized protein n=1 Tax=Parasponia andersonii TaxID=3476 RepID=A0A2P5DEK0_PARAD|nr:LOW QUALITY PROTEIN: hypothetical protein PanWU01x14_071580 [Parasponia andersonii]